MYQPRTNGKYFKVHQLNICLVIMIIICVIPFVLSVEADDRYHNLHHHYHGPPPRLKHPNSTAIIKDSLYSTPDSTLDSNPDSTPGSTPGGEISIMDMSTPTVESETSGVSLDFSTTENYIITSKTEETPDMMVENEYVECSKDDCNDNDRGGTSMGDYLDDSTYKPLEAPIKTPEQELHEMIEGLGTLLSNESAVVTVKDVSNAFDQMDTLLATDDESLEFPSTVLTALDALGARADLNGSASVATARTNVAVVMADSAPERPVRGLRIPVDGFTKEGIQILHETVDPSTLLGDNTDAAVDLPASLADSSRRISFVVFRSDRAFARRDHAQYVVNSKIISVHVENFTQMEEGEVIDIYLKPSIYKPARNMSRSCAYWHFAENDTGYWSQEGCTLIKSPTGLLDICRCTHLTHFAEVLVPKAVFSEDNETALEIISLIGCFLSLFGLLMIALTAIMFRPWRSDFNNKIWLQLTLALLMHVISFLIVVFSKFEDYDTFCMAVGMILHYTVLASFCWMLVAAVISYRKLVLVFATDPRRRLLKASAFSWLFPLSIVVTLVSVAPQSYIRRFEGHTPTGAFCYPSGLSLWLAVYLPIALVVISNWVLFGLILRSVFGTKKIQKHGDSSELLRRASVSCLLVFLFGLPWVFGLFAYNIVAAYLFTLTTSYQGFVLFIFFIVINSKTRGMWLDKLRIKKKTKGPVSSLLTSKNAHISNELEQVPFIDPNSSRTNMTSLVSNASEGKLVKYNIPSGSAVIEELHYNSKDSDIDSYITAKSHDNFSEDEIFKSIEGITDVIDDVEENNIKKSKSASGTNSRNSLHTETLMLSDKDVQGYNDNTSNKNDSSRRRIDDDNFVSPEITVYNVATQSASLIS